MFSSFLFWILSGLYFLWVITFYKAIISLSFRVLAWLSIWRHCFVYSTGSEFFSYHSLFYPFHSPYFVRFENFWKSLTQFGILCCIIHVFHHFGHLVHILEETLSSVSQVIYLIFCHVSSCYFTHVLRDYSSHSCFSLSEWDCRVTSCVALGTDFFIYKWE